MSATSPRAGTAALVIGVALAALALDACSRSVPVSQRSVVLVTLDTTRSDRLGVYGGTAVPTPNLDRIASEGTLFENAVSQVPLTLPSHSSLLTGRYPASLGVRHNGIFRLPQEATTLTERLAEEGFDTAAFVSSFVLNRGFGVEQGFARFDDVPVDRFQGNRDQLFEAERSADDVNRQVFRWLDERDRNRRFFLWVHYYDPHTPYDAPEREGRTLHGSGYDREISYLDACFGDLVDRLRDEGLLDSTILVVAGDHGEGLGDHGEYAHGIFLYEATTHVPLFVRAPGLVPAGTRIEGPVELVSVAATVLDLLELGPLEEAQGASLVPRIEGRDEGQDTTAHAETYMPRLDYGWSELVMIRDERFKLISAPTPELYDLRDDPGETVNLFHEDPERSQRMAASLAAWTQSIVDPSAESRAARTLSPEELERIKSLGYLGGEGSTTEADDGSVRPDPKEMIGQLGRFLEARRRLNSGDALGALEVSDAILDDDPGNHQAAVTRILALIDLKRLAEAEQLAVAHVEATSGDPAASAEWWEGGLELVATIYRRQGRLDEAERHYRLVLELNPDCETATIDLATLLVESGRVDAAREIVDGLLARHPTSGMALATRFRLEEQAGDEEAARRTAVAMADARGGDSEALVRAGRLLFQDDPARAAVCLELALAGMELDAQLLQQLGVAQARSGRLKDARETLMAASRMLPRDPTLQYRLGVVALELGDEKEGRFRLEQALRLDPGHLEAQELLQRLEGS
jgi:arylsulfatase A-like enzyme/tetratricopeptide (TPR) repeat protein